MQLGQVVNSRPLVIIRPRLPPQVCGIGTYSWLLHENWPAETSDQKFVVINGAAESAGILHYSDISEFAGSAVRLSATLDAAGPVDVLLHYAGRAYHRYGCPRWLPRVLRAWKEKFPGGRLIVLFHEVPARLPIVSRHYL